MDSLEYGDSTDDLKKAAGRLALKVYAGNVGEDVSTKIRGISFVYRVRPADSNMIQNVFEKGKKSLKEQLSDMIDHLNG